MIFNHIIKQLCGYKGLEIIAGKIMPDHIVYQVL